MKLEKQFVGKISLPNGKVDVVDPCYDKDVWCQKTLDVVAGSYNCYAYTSGPKAEFGRRVFIAQIVLDTPEAEEKAKQGRWTEVGSVGVDSALAGFFDDKPDFPDGEWKSLCEWMENNSDHPMCKYFIKKFNGRDGFWTSSGVGDGCYGIYAKKIEGKIVALELRF